MNLREFLDQMRVKVVERANAFPDDYEWKKSDTWAAFDVGVSQMLINELPKSIELDPEK
jgi:hypothetical protein